MPANTLTAKQTAPDAEDRLSALYDWPTQTPARIQEVNTTPELAARLEGLGLCPGRTVRLIKRGEPCILKVYGARIGLAAHLAGAVMVGPDSAE